MKLKKYLVSGVVLTAVLILAGALALRQPVRENVTPPGMKIAEVNEGDTPIKFDIPSGNVIKEVLFSSYGNPTIGSDGMPIKGSCHADTWIKKECEGKAPPTCTDIKAHNHYWQDPCPGTYKKLMVAYTVGPAPSATNTSGAGAATNTPVTNTATGKPLTPFEKATAEAAAAKAAAEKLAAEKTAAEKTAPFKDELFGFEFKDEKQAKMVYGGAGIALLLIIGGVLMFVLRKRPAPRPMYGMGRRRH